MGKTVDPEFQAFASTLRNARQLLGMSQAQIAEVIGVAQASYSAWEKGQVEPDRATVRRVEEILGFPPGGLSQHLSPPYFPAETVRGPVRGRKQPPQTEDAIRLDSRLDPRDRDVLIATFRAMTSRRKAASRVSQQASPRTGCSMEEAA